MGRRMDATTTWLLAMSLQLESGERTIAGCASRLTDTSVAFMPLLRFGSILIVFSVSSSSRSSNSRNCFASGCEALT